jgi:hypothetical protein
MTNPLRRRMVQQSVANATYHNLPITVENVRRYLPGPNADKELKGVGGVPLREQPDFELDATDLEPWVATEPAPVTAEPEDAPVTEPPLVALPAPAPRLNRQQQWAAASAKLVALDAERADLRVELEIAHRDELTARRERDQIAHAFMKGFGPPMTPNDLIRQHLASEADTRRKVAAGEIPPRRRSSGPSMIDRFAAVQRGGNPGFAGNGFRRGAYSSARAAALGFQVPKLPSQR